jgi:hypothetical protein
MQGGSVVGKSISQNVVRRLRYNAVEQILNFEYSGGNGVDRI